jgi:glycosyltransferase involved in cell wall biosynthesis
MIRGEGITARFVLLGRRDPFDPDSVDGEILEEAVRDGIIDAPGHTDDIRTFLAHADCVVLPSYYREGIPRSLLEAASMAKPIIAADSVGTREPVLDGINGFLCKPRDSHDLAAKMRAVLRADPVHLAAMGEASRRLAVERFDERMVISVYLEAIRTLVGTSEASS